MISTFASDKGWLFSDLLLRYSELGCSAGFAPDPEAESWLCLRSSEAHLSPDPERTVVQIHCQVERWVGKPAVLNRCAGFIYTHPNQPAMLQRMGVQTDKPHICRPIGSAMSFTLREAMPETFTVGWVGRATGMKGEDLFVEAMKRVAKCVDCQVLLVGAQLEGMADELQDGGVSVELRLRKADQPFDAEMYRDAYHSMDVLAITSETEAGPLPLFEALSCGVPVVSTDVGWSSRMLGGVCGLVTTGKREALQVDIQSIGMSRNYHFKRRQAIRDRQPWRLEDWLQETIDLTERIAG